MIYRLFKVFNQTLNISSLKKRMFSLIFISFFVLVYAFCQKYNIDYYGIVATEIDINMSKMTSDLYYTQLCEISSLSVNDKRISERMTEIPDINSFIPSNYSFYAQISKNEKNAKWISTITLINIAQNTRLSESKEYDSFYKILMEPKSVLQTSLKNLILNKSSTGSSIDFTDSSSSNSLLNTSLQSAEQINQNPNSVTTSTNNSNSNNIIQKGTRISSTEFLSGTWNGENNIDKIVIMRGGRGFVIFANGASMNITVQLENSNDNSSLIVVTQNGKPNASFFPELSRQVALKEAINAKPIQWIFSVSNDNTLTGQKNTLIENEGNAIQASIDVIWTRKS